MPLATLNASEFARLCGVAQSTVSDWMKAGMPHEAAGRKGVPALIDIEQALPWVITSREPPAGSQRDRVAKEQADKLAIANAREQKHLVLAEHVSYVMTAMAADIAGRLDGLPGRMANELAGINDPAEIRSRLLDECRSVRAGFASYVAKLVKPEEDSAGRGVDDDAAPESERVRVG